MSEVAAEMSARMIYALQAAIDWINALLDAYWSMPYENRILGL